MTKSRIRIIENTVSVNGIKYKQNEPEQKSRMSSRLLALTSIAKAVSGMGMPSIHERKRPSVDIVKEFELIQNKKSNLSKNDRDWVEYMFHRNYTLYVEDSGSNI